MLVIFHVNMITCQIFNLPHIYCIFVEKNHFLKLITWYPNMIQTIWNDMVQYTLNFHKKIKIIKIIFEVYFCFWIHTYTPCVSTSKLQSPTL